MHPSKQIRPFSQLVPSAFWRFPSSFPSLLEEFENRIGELHSWEQATGISVSEDDQHVFVEAQVPGLKESDLEVSLHQNTLWIKGEKKQEVEDQKRRWRQKAQSSFFYQVGLPEHVEEEGEAQCENGVLHITFKKSKVSQLKKIPITAAKPNQKK